MCYVEEFKRAKTPLWAKRCRLWVDTKQADDLSGVCCDSTSEGPAFHRQMLFQVLKPV